MLKLQVDLSPYCPTLWTNSSFGQNLPVAHTELPFLESLSFLHPEHPPCPSGQLYCVSLQPQRDNPPGKQALHALPNTLPANAAPGFISSGPMANYMILLQSVNSFIPVSLKIIYKSPKFDQKCKLRETLN